MQKINLKKFVQTNEQQCLWQNNGNFKKKINVRLVNNAEDYLKYVSKPTFISKKDF